MKPEDYVMVPGPFGGLVRGRVWAVGATSVMVTLDNGCHAILPLEDAQPAACAVCGQGIEREAELAESDLPDLTGKPVHAECCRRAANDAEGARAAAQ